MFRTIVSAGFRFCLPLLLGAGLTALPTVVRADDTKTSAALAGAAKPVAAKAAPAVVADTAPLTVLAQINDLGLLKALLPLKLTGEQIGALLTAMRAAAEDGKKRAQADDAALRALAADVAKAHAEALAGNAIPDELETRVAAASATAETRGKRARAAATGKILDAAHDALTPEQQDRIEAASEKALGGKLVPKEFQADPSKAPKQAVRDLAMAQFIQNVLLNERSIEVLSQMKPSAPAKP